MLESFGASSLIRILVISLATCFVPLYGFGRKGDPVSRPRTKPAACDVEWSSYRILEIKLPVKDEHHHSLVGIDKIRIYYLSLDQNRPTGDAIVAKGKVIMEQRRSNVTNLRDSVKLDLRQLNYSSGWLTVVAMRVGDVIGVPSETLVWLDSSG